MRCFIICLIAIILFMGLTYSGKSVFGMTHGGMMGNIECLNHCIRTTTVPIVPAIAFSALFIVIFLLVEYVGQFRLSARNTMMTWRRRTEFIRLFFLSRMLSPVFIRD